MSTKRQSRPNDGALKRDYEPMSLQSVTCFATREDDHRTRQAEWLIGLYQKVPVDRIKRYQLLDDTTVIISRKLQEFLLCENDAHLFPLQLTGDKAAGDKAAGDKAAKDMEDKDMEEEAMAPVEMIELF